MCLFIYSRLSTHVFLSKGHAPIELRHRNLFTTWRQLDAASLMAKSKEISLNYWIKVESRRLLDMKAIHHWSLWSHNLYSITNRTRPRIPSLMPETETCQNAYSMYMHRSQDCWRWQMLVIRRRKSRNTSRVDISDLPGSTLISQCYKSKGIGDVILPILSSSVFPL